MYFTNHVFFFVNLYFVYLLLITFCTNNFIFSHCFNPNSSPFSIFSIKMMFPLYWYLMLSLSLIVTMIVVFFLLTLMYAYLQYIISHIPYFIYIYIYIFVDMMCILNACSALYTHRLTSHDITMVLAWHHNGSCIYTCHWYWCIHTLPHATIIPSVQFVQSLCPSVWHVQQHPYFSWSWKRPYWRGNTEASSVNFKRGRPIIALSSARRIKCHTMP